MVVRRTLTVRCILPSCIKLMVVRCITQGYTGSFMLLTKNTRLVRQADSIVQVD